MGQALRRVSGRIGSSAPPQVKKPVDRRPTPTPSATSEKLVGNNVGPGAESTSRANAEEALEERDPKFDAMLSQMVGRIQAKPGGKPEMGEAFVVEKYNRPLPKGKADDHDGPMDISRIAERFRIDVAQVQQILQFVSLPPEDSNRGKN